MIWVFTGESALSSAEDEFVRGRLAWMSQTAIRPGDVIVTGAAYGVDSVVAMYFHEYRPGLRQFIYYPSARHNMKLVSQAARGRWATVRRVDPPYTGASSGACYMARNSAMVNHGGKPYDTVVVGFPRTKRELIRSGPWATVRRARKAQVSDELIFALEGGAREGEEA